MHSMGIKFGIDDDYCMGARVYNIRKEEPFLYYELLVRVTLYTVKLEMTFA